MDHERCRDSPYCREVTHPEDGLSVRCVGKWAETKHFYLRRYIDIFTTAMRDKWKLAYVDLFAGPGKCVRRDTGAFLDGSPLIALGTRFPFHSYHFVELNPQCMDALRSRCQTIAIGGRVRYYQEDCNDAVEKIRQGLGPGTLALAFIDPTGLQFRFDSLRRLAEGSRVDLIVTFMDHLDIRRNLEQHYLKRENRALDEFLGTNKWRNRVSALVAQGQTKAALTEIRDVYLNQLSTLGYAKDLTSDAESVRVRTDTSRAPLYLMLFAAKDKKGIEFWNKIRLKEEDGQGRLF
jgi:three-Cys-motif partner protein